jgi:hypothetical protein
VAAKGEGPLEALENEQMNWSTRNRTSLKD